MTEIAPVVAVVNADFDANRLLLSAFRQRGFVAVGCGARHLRGAGLFAPTRRGNSFDFPAFIRRHNPDVVVFHVDPAYEESVRVFRHFRRTVLRDLPVALTTTDPGRLEQVLEHEDAGEVLLKPSDVNELVQFARHALEDRETAA